MRWYLDDEQVERTLVAALHALDQLLIDIAVSHPSVPGGLTAQGGRSSAPRFVHGLAFVIDLIVGALAPEGSRCSGCADAFAIEGRRECVGARPATGSRARVEMKMEPQRKVINHGAANTHQACTFSGSHGTVRRIAQPARPSPIDSPAATASPVRSRPSQRGTPTGTATAMPVEPATDDTDPRQRGDRQQHDRRRERRLAAPTCSHRRSRRDGYTDGHRSGTQIRLKTRVPLVPPKPNEFFIATSIFISRAVLAQ